MKVIIDSGHGINTPGKCSPDKRILEYKYARELTEIIVNKLKALEIEVVNLMQGIEIDEPLYSRCKRINKLVELDKNSFLISIHLNASGAGKWYNASGWSVYVSNNASVNSKLLAETLYNAASNTSIKTRKPSLFQKYWVKNLAICRDTKCPAVLVENMFMDNKQDVEYLLSEEGKENLSNIIVNGVKKFISYK